MKKQLIVYIVIGLISITGCSSKETVQPYVRQTESKVETESKIETEVVEDNTEQIETEQIETEQIETEQIESNTEHIESNTEQTESETKDSEVELNKGSTIEEEYIDNGSISDRSISMGKAYIGNIEFTVEKVAEKFSDLSSYESNELTKETAEITATFLNNLSEYELINKWNEYESLEKSERYALIILTRYEQSFGGYNKTSMKNSLNNDSTYKEDLKNIDSDLK